MEAVRTSGIPACASWAAGAGSVRCGSRACCAGGGMGGSGTFTASPPHQGLWLGGGRKRDGGPGEANEPVCPERPAQERRKDVRRNRWFARLGRRSGRGRPDLRSASRLARPVRFGRGARGAGRVRRCLCGRSRTQGRRLDLTVLLLAHAYPYWASYLAVRRRSWTGDRHGTTGLAGPVADDRDQARVVRALPNSPRRFRRNGRGRDGRGRPMGHRRATCAGARGAEAGRSGHAPPGRRAWRTPTIRRRRDALDLTQDELGKMLNPTMTRASIANIEAGKQRVLAHTLVDLANALQLTLDDLASGADVRAAELEEELQQATGLGAKAAKARTEKILAPKRRRKSA